MFALPAEVYIHAQHAIKMSVLERQTSVEMCLNVFSVISRIERPAAI